MDEQIQQLQALLGESEWMVSNLRQRAAGLNVEVQKRDQQIQDLLTRIEELEHQKDSHAESSKEAK